MEQANFIACLVIYLALAKTACKRSTLRNNESVNKQNRLNTGFDTLLTENLYPGAYAACIVLNCVGVIFVTCLNARLNAAFELKPASKVSSVIDLWVWFLIA